MQKKTKIGKKIAVAYLFIIVAAVFLLLNPVLAQVNPFGGYEGAVESALGLGNRDPRVIIANIIRIALGFLGVIAIALVIYAGWLWMTSGGNEQKITQAKRILTNAAIGLLIILASFGIVTFILNSLITATTTGTGRGSGSGSGGIAALGSGIIQSHYPARDATDVARNTRIVITFREPINLADIITAGQINAANILIYKTSDGSAGPFITNVAASSTPDNRTFVFRPSQYLGSPSEKIWYTVALARNIRKLSGQPAFTGVVGTIGYSWSFEVGTTIDVRSPQVMSVIPYPGSTEPRNVVIQINFDEAVNPLSGSGASIAGFNNIVVTNVTDGVVVNGNFYISNQYRTVEFLTENVCGTNSCGNTVFCLPGNKNLSTLVKAATLALAGQPTAVFPYDGVVDMADNSLDGNKDNAAQGPEAQSTQPPYNANAPDAANQGDDYFWSFNTNNTIDISAPVIESVSPSLNEVSVNLNAVPQATFSKILMSSSLTPSSVTISSAPPAAINYWLNKTDDITNKRTTARINHDQFDDNTAYSPQFHSGIRDIYQNCYSPCSGLGVTGTPSSCNGVPSAAPSCP